MICGLGFINSGIIINTELKRQLFSLTDIKRVLVLVKRRSFVKVKVYIYFFIRLYCTTVRFLAIANFNTKNFQ